MTFPSNPAEYEEYVSIMNEMAEQAIASTPDPEPQDFGREDYSPDEESDELRQREEDDELRQREEDEGRDDFDPEDRYLDSQWEDANEYGMEGCCGDF